MVYARKSNREFNRQMVTRILANLSLAVASVLVFAIAAGSVSANVRSAERRNTRIRVPSAAASAVKPMNVPLPFAPIDVDRTDDAAAASACTVAPNDCSLRGAVAFANLNPGTTINIPAGTYQLNIPGGAGEGFSGNNAIGDLDIIASNTIIAGAGSATTIIQQTQPNDRVIEVNPFLDANFNFDISGVTITGGKETTAVGGGGIISGSIGNTMSVTNCVFSGNSATGLGTLGGGGLLHTGGSLTITGTVFSNNSTSTSGGGLNYTAGDPLFRTPSLGTLTVSGSAFNSNTANSAAAGGGGADLYDFNGGLGSYNISSTSFFNNSAPNASGGAIIIESGGPATVTTSSFSGNTAGVSGGAITSHSSTSVTYSRLVGNTVTNPLNGLTLFQAGGTFAANDNWWGINTGPGANDFRSVGGPLFPASYLQLRMIATPNVLCSGQTSSLVADIKQRNIGGPLTTELNGLPTFMAVFNNATLGTLSATTNFVDGVATATFTAGATPGTGGADVTGDNQTVSVVITVDTNATTDPADQVVCEGDTASFTTTASGPGPITFVWKKGATVLNNGDLGGRVTITSGPTTSTLSISGTVASDSDIYTVEASGSCSTATQSATLTVNPTTTATDPVDQTVCQGATASFSTTATGTDLHYAWTLDGSPFNGDSPSINVPTGALSVGSHTVGLTVTGSCGIVSHTATLTVQANTVASDPADQTVCQGTPASFSTTATGDNLHYAWTLDGSPFNGDSPSINVPTGSLSVGSHTVVVTVTGSCGTVVQTANLTVNATTQTTDPADQTVCQGTNANFSTVASGTGPFTYSWTLDGNPVGGNSPNVSIPTGSLSVGNHTVVVTTTGSSCGSAMQTAILTVSGGTPVINLITNTATMWPPNHKYQTFNVSDFVSSATAGCGGGNITNSVVIQKVSSDEPENSNGGDGNTVNDIVIAPNCKSVQLRSERDGNLNGRVYTITFKVTDSFGNSATATVKVKVPINNNGTAVDNGAAAGYTVNSLCP